MKTLFGMKFVKILSLENYYLRIVVVCDKFLNHASHSMEMLKTIRLTVSLVS